MTVQHVEPREPTPTPNHVRERPDAVAWQSHGFYAGVLGAGVVAVFLLIVDFAAGRPLWTPASLGAALFTGDRLSAAAFEPGNHLAVVAGYTAVHVGIFVALSSCAAFFMMTTDRAMRPIAGVAAGAAVVLFILFELTFLAQAALFGPNLTEGLAGGWVAAANALASFVIGFYLARRAGPRAPRGRADLPKP